MQEQLKRIRNKDLTSLDEKLFGNLDKVETINSTLTNLQQFQKFLVAQIGQFEKNAKCASPGNQIKQVITQNCDTLRQSILRAVPEMECSRAKLRDQIVQIQQSRVGGKSRIVQSRVYKKQTHIQNSSFTIQESRTMKRTQQFKSVYKDKQIQKNQYLKDLSRYKQLISNLKRQVDQLKDNLSQIKYKQRSQFKDLQYEIHRNIEKKVTQLFKDNTQLRQSVQKLNRQKKQLQRQLNEYKNFKDQSQKTQIQKQSINKFFKPSIKLQQKQQQKSLHSDYKISKPQRNYLQQPKIQQCKFYSQNQLKKFLIYQNISTSDNKQKSRQQESSYQHFQTYGSYGSSLKTSMVSQTLVNAHKSIENSQSKYKSFKEKMNLDFSSKLIQHEISGSLKNQSSQLQSEIFKEFNVQKSLNEQFDRKNEHKRLFTSIQLHSSVNDKENNRYAPQIPRPLRRHSVHYRSSNMQQSKPSKVLQESKLINEQTIRQRNSQSLSKGDSNDMSLNRKKSNHDLMRKTKSNFFKKNISNVENMIEANLINMKGVTNSNNQSQQKYKLNGSGTKQKLKIFSFI